MTGQHGINTPVYTVLCLMSRMVLHSSTDIVVDTAACHRNQGHQDVNESSWGGNHQKTYPWHTTRLLLYWGWWPVGRGSRDRSVCYLEGKAGLLGLYCTVAVIRGSPTLLQENRQTHPFLTALLQRYQYLFCYHRCCSVLQAAASAATTAAPTAATMLAACCGHCLLFGPYSYTVICACLWTVYSCTLVSTALEPHS